MPVSVTCSRGRPSVAASVMVISPVPYAAARNGYRRRPAEQALNHDPTVPAVANTKIGSSYVSRFFDAADWLEIGRRCGPTHLPLPNRAGIEIVRRLKRHGPAWGNLACRAWDHHDQPAVPVHDRRARLHAGDRRLPEGKTWAA